MICWNCLPDSVDFTSLPCFNRSLGTVDVKLLLSHLLALCFVHLCGKLSVPPAFLSYGTLSERLFFMLFYL